MYLPGTIVSKNTKYSHGREEQVAAKHNSSGMCTINVETNKEAKTMKRKDRDPHEAKTMSETIQTRDTRLGAWFICRQ